MEGGQDISEGVGELGGFAWGELVQFVFVAIEPFEEAVDGGAIEFGVCFTDAHFFDVLAANPLFKVIFLWNDEGGFS